MNNRCLTLVRRIILMLSLLPLALPSRGIAQTPPPPSSQVILSGYVLDRDRKPIELASIRIEGTLLGTWCDPKGAYQLTLPSSTDTIRITYSSIGYRSFTQVFPQGITQSQHFNATLVEGDEEIETIIVQGNNSRTRGIESIRTEHLAVEASPTRSIESLLATYAGVTQQNELSNQYNVRGGSFDENLVYVNGIEVYRPLLIRSAQQEGLSIVNSDLVSQVHFSAGAFDAQYGDRISSVLDIRYKRPDALEALAVLGLMNNNLYFGGTHGRFTHATGIRTRTTQHLLSKLETSGEYHPFFSDLQTHLTYRINDQWSTAFTGVASLSQYHYIPHQRQTTIGSLANAKKFTVYFDGQERDHFLTLFGALSTIYHPHERALHQIDLSLYQSNERETYDISGAYYLQKEGGGPSSDPKDTQGVEDNQMLATGVNLEHARNFLQYRIAALNYRGSYRLNSEHRLQWGGELRSEYVRDFISEWTKLDSAGYNLPHYPSHIQMQTNLHSEVILNTLRLSLYLQDQMQWQTASGRYTLTAGARTSYWTFNQYLQVSPRLVASWQPHDHKELLVRLAGGLYFQSPFYKEIRTIATDSIGNQSVLLNPRLKPQGAAQILAGIDYDFQVADRPFRFTTELYYKHLFWINPYYVDNIKLRYLGRNMGVGYVAGFDLKLYGEFVPDVDSWLTLSLMRGRQNIRGYGSMPLPNVPDYSLSLFFQDYFPGYKRITLSLRGVVSGGLPQLNAARGFGLPLFQSPPYKRIDLGMQYLLWERSQERLAPRWMDAIRSVAIGVSIFNLFDMANIGSYYWIADAYRNEYAVPNYLTGRQFDLSLVLRF